MMTMNLKDIERSRFAVVQVGNKNEIKDLGIKADIYNYPENTTEWELDDELTHLQEFYDGVILHLPFPPHIRQEVAMAAVDSNKLMIMEENI